MWFDRSKAAGIFTLSKRYGIEKEKSDTSCLILFSGLDTMKVYSIEPDGIW